MKIFNRLYLKVYFTVVGTLLLAVVVSDAVWRTGPEMDTAATTRRPGPKTGADTDATPASR